MRIVFGEPPATAREPTGSAQRVAAASRGGATRAITVRNRMRRWTSERLKDSLLELLPWTSMPPAPLLGGYLIIWEISVGHGQFRKQSVAAYSVAQQIVGQDEY